MAATNITIDDTSPLIQYVPEGSWTHASGSDAQAYVNQTFSSTTVEGATASVTFNGTGYWLFGAKKPSYGQLIILCDDRVVSFPNATAPQAEFAQMLGGEFGLEDRQHVLTFMSAGEMDIDSIMLETTAQESQQEFSSVATVFNAIAASTATSSSATAASTARLSANPNTAPPNNQDNGSNGPQTSTDGQNRGVPAQPNASSSSAAEPSASTVTVSSTSAVQSSHVPSSTNGASNQATSSSEKSGLSKGAMIGIAVGATISILLLLLLLFFILRRRRARARAQNMTAMQSPALPLQDPDPERASSFFAGRGSYFFTGFGSGGGGGNNSNPNSGRNSAGAGGSGSAGGDGGGGGMTDADRAQYLARGPSMRSAGGFPSMPPPPAGAGAGGRNPSGLPEEDEMALARGFAEQDAPTLRFVDVPLAAPAAAVTTPAGARQSAHSLQASVYGVAYGGGGGGGSDGASVYSHSSFTPSSGPRPLTPSRPNRPPDLQL